LVTVQFSSWLLDSSGSLGWLVGWSVVIWLVVGCWRYVYGWLLGCLVGWLVCGYGCYGCLVGYGYVGWLVVTVVSTFGYVCYVVTVAVTFTVAFGSPLVVGWLVTLRTLDYVVTVVTVAYVPVLAVDLHTVVAFTVVWLVDLRFTFIWLVGCCWLFCCCCVYVTLRLRSRLVTLWLRFGYVCYVNALVVVAFAFVGLLVVVDLVGGWLLLIVGWLVTVVVTLVVGCWLRYLVGWLRCCCYLLVVWLLRLPRCACPVVGCYGWLVGCC